VFSSEDELPSEEADISGEGAFKAPRDLLVHLFGQPNEKDQWILQFPLGRFPSFSIVAPRQFDLWGDGEEVLNDDCWVVRGSDDCDLFSVVKYIEEQESSVTVPVFPWKHASFLFENKSEPKAKKQKVR